MKESYRDLSEIAEVLADFLGEGGPYCPWDSLPLKTFEQLVRAIDTARNSGIISSQDMASFNQVLDSIDAGDYLSEENASRAQRLLNLLPKQMTIVAENKKSS